MKALILFLAVSGLACAHVKEAALACKDPVIAQAAADALPRIAQAMACSGQEDVPACLKAQAKDLAMDTGSAVLACGLAKLHDRTEEAKAVTVDGGQD